MWDWLQLLIIPVVLAIGGYFFNLATSRNEHKIASDNQREAALQAYIDKVSELLLHERLGESAPPHEVAIIARARTATVLRILDPVRRGSLIQFLSQSGILAICVENSIKGSFDSPLNNENSLLYGADLQGATLIGTNLERANLWDAVITQEQWEKAKSLAGAIMPDGSKHP